MEYSPAIIYFESCNSLLTLSFDAYNVFNCNVWLWATRRDFLGTWLFYNSQRWQSTMCDIT
jgi:hypothetical protein